MPTLIVWPTGLRSTPPSREATINYRANAITERLRSTPPSREATSPPLLDHEEMRVAIHAPLAGGDTLQVRI